MASSIDYGISTIPRLVRAAQGTANERTTNIYYVKDSQTLFLGNFVELVRGTSGAPLGAEFGIRGYEASKPIYGVVVKITHSRSSTLPIQDDPARSGTLTDAVLLGSYVEPLTYAFTSTNDESHTTSAKLETVEVMPIQPNDIWEVSLVNSGGTAYVNRGTTTAAGTTGSSDNMGVGLSVNTTLPYALTESSAANALIGLDFMTTLLDGKKPPLPYRVYVQALRGQFAYALPIV